MIQAPTAAVLAAAIGALVATGPTHAATEIRTSVGVPQKHPAGNPGYTGYAAAVEKASQSRLKFQLYWGGQLLGLRNTVDGLKNGVADLALIATAYFPAEFPNGKLVSDIALLGRDSITMAAAVTEFHHLHCADCINEYESQNIIYSGAYSTDVYQLLGTTKITAIGDLKGKKVRSGGANWTRWLNSVGAVPVNLSGDDVYQALSNGVIDASIASMAHLKAFSLSDVVTDVTLLPLGTFHAVNLMAYRRDFWRGLAAADREVLLRHMPRALVETTLTYVAQAEAVVLPAKQKGIQLHEPDAQLLKAVSDFARADIAVISAEATKQGVRDADAKVERLIALLEKWETTSKRIGRDENALTAALKGEIFDKIDATRFGM